MKILLFFFSLVLHATTIFIESNALSTTNDSGHATMDLSGPLHPNPSWAAPLLGSFWISYGSTGAHKDPGYFSPPNGTEVTFTTPFILSGLITGGILRVMADDSAFMILNGHALIAAETTTGHNCSNHPIGCLGSTGTFTFVEFDPFLVDGTNMLSFGVVQLAGSSFGLDFAGCIDTTPTPEPSTLGILGGGLLALASLSRRT